MKTFLGTATLALALSSPLSAQVVYNGGTASGPGNNFTYERVANSFTLPTTTTFDSLRVFTWSNTGPLTGAVDWNVFTDNNGSPGTSLFSGIATQWQSLNPLDNVNGNYEYDFGLGGSRTLTAGNFWVAIHSGGLVNPATDPNNPNFYWRTEIGGSDPRPYSGFAFQVITDPSQTWQNCGDVSLCSPEAFQLLADARTTTTPEPSSMALLGTGLVGLVPVLRRRRNQPPSNI